MGSLASERAVKHHMTLQKSGDMVRLRPNPVFTGRALGVNLFLSQTLHALPRPWGGSPAPLGCPQPQLRGTTAAGFGPQPRAVTLRRPPHARRRRRRRRARYKNLIGAESGCSTRHRDLLAASSLYFRPQTQTSDHPSPSENEGGIPIAAVRPRSKEVVHSGT